MKSSSHRLPNALTRVVGWIDRNPRVCLALILVVALAVRMAALPATSDYQPIYDSADYERHAQSIAAGDGFPDAIIGSGDGPSAFRPPLYPYVLGATYALSGNEAGVEAGRILGGLFGVATVALIFLLARELGGPRAGLLAAGIAAVFPPLALVHLALISEPIFLVLEVGALFCVVKARESGALGWASAAGALCGLAALTRGNGLLLVLVAALAVWILRPRLSVRALRAPVVLGLVALLVVAPWTARNAIVFDTFVPISSQNGYGMAGAFNDEAREDSEASPTWVQPELTDRYEDILARTDLNEAELDRELRSSATDYLWANPGAMPEAIGLNILRVLGIANLGAEEKLGDQQQLGLGPKLYALTRWSFLALAAASIVAYVFVRRKRPEKLPPAFILAAPALLVLSAVWILGNTRYRVPLDPIVVLLVGLGITSWLETRLPKGESAQPAG